MSAVETENRKAIEAEVRVQLEAEFAQKWAKKERELTDENEKTIQGVLETYLEEQRKTKLNATELNALLSQEYATFTVKVPYVEEGATEPKEKEFTLRELPQSIEKKFYRTFKDKLKKHMKEITVLVKDVGDGKIEGRVEAILEIFEPAFEMLCEATALVLNPYNKDQDVNAQWCADNLSSARMWNVLLAQEYLNKLRSFFSNVSLASLERKVI